MRFFATLLPTKTLMLNQVITRDEFDTRLRKCYFNAKQFENVLPRLIEASDSYELTLALTDAIPIARRHTNRLVQIFDSIQSPISGLRCKSIEAHFVDLNTLSDKFAKGFSRDNAIILQCQKIMSLDISALTILNNFAVAEKNTTLSHYLKTAISEEKDAHAILTEIALQSIYFEQAV